jgi:hypothetical protein
MPLEGAEEEATRQDGQGPQAPAGPVPPRPASGHSQEGHDARTQVRWSLGVSSDGGVPLRLGVRDGNTRESPETPGAIAACLALGRAGRCGLGADRNAYGQRPWGLGLEKRVGRITLVPRPCAVRQALAAWGPPPGALPWWRAQPGRTRQESPRQWHGQRVVRRVEGASSEGRVALAARRCGGVHSHQCAQQAALSDGKAHTHEAERVAAHLRRVEARRVAWAAEAETALAAYEGRGQGRRGRRPRPWRSHALGSQVEAGQQRKKRARTGRPPQAEPPQAAGS